VRTLPVGNHVYSVVFSPDGRWVATAGRSRSAPGTLWHQVSAGRWDGESQGVRVWRVSDGALAATLAGHTDDVWAVAISHDGHWLATSSEDRTAKLWRMEAR
jgi:WD40 repeat protein